MKSKKKSLAEDLEWALSSIENGKLVSIPSFGSPTYSFSAENFDNI